MIQKPTHDSLNLPCNNTQTHSWKSQFALQQDTNPLMKVSICFATIHKPTNESLNLPCNSIKKTRQRLNLACKKVKTAHTKNKTKPQQSLNMAFNRTHTYTHTHTHWTSVIQKKLIKDSINEHGNLRQTKLVHTALTALLLIFTYLNGRYFSLSLYWLYSKNTIIFTYPNGRYFSLRLSLYWLYSKNTITFTYLNSCYFPQSFYCFWSPHS